MNKLRLCVFIGTLFFYLHNLNLTYAKYYKQLVLLPFATTQQDYRRNPVAFFTILFLPVPYILTRCNSFYLFKLLVEIRNIIKSTFIADSGDIHFVFYQEFTGMAYSYFI